MRQLVLAGVLALTFSFAPVAGQAGIARPGDLCDDETVSLLSMKVALAGRSLGVVDAECGFDSAPWAGYRPSARSAELRFMGGARGQGIGWVFGGIAAAAQLAATRRRLVIDYKVGGEPLAGFVRPGRGAPRIVARTGPMMCNHSLVVWTWGQSTPIDEVFADASDTSRYPTLCYTGGFAGEAFTSKVDEALGIPDSSTAAKMGCALQFMFDIPPPPKSDMFTIVGHLRLGDAYIAGGGDASDTGRSVLTDVSWGLGDVSTASSAFVHCMQGLAEQLVPDRSVGCRVVLLSDSKRAKRLAAASSRKGRCAVVVDTQVDARHSAVGHFDHRTMSAVVDDLFAIARADAALVTHSGFGRSGSAMGPALQGRNFLFERILQGSGKSRDAIQTAARSGEIKQVCRLASPVADNEV